MRGAQLSSDQDPTSKGGLISKELAVKRQQLAPQVRNKRMVIKSLFGRTGSRRVLQNEDYVPRHEYVQRIGKH